MAFSSTGDSHGRSRWIPSAELRTCRTGRWRKSISSLDQPLVMRVGFTYSIPKLGPKVVSLGSARLAVQRLPLLRQRNPSCCSDRECDGIPSTSRSATISNLTFQTGQLQVRTGQPLYLHDLNCHCFDPNTTFVLNPAAWTNPAPGSMAARLTTATYRGERRPTENFSLRTPVPDQGKVEPERACGVYQHFQPHVSEQSHRERRRHQPANGADLQAADRRERRLLHAGQQIVSGFGSIDTSTVAYPPRTGQIVARFDF